VVWRGEKLVPEHERLVGGKRGGSIANDAEPKVRLKNRIKKVFTRPRDEQLPSPPAVGRGKRRVGLAVDGADEDPRGDGEVRAILGGERQEGAEGEEDGGKQNDLRLDVADDEGRDDEHVEPLLPKRYFRVVFQLGDERHLSVPEEYGR
jgi:hypothetical protein